MKDFFVLVAIILFCILVTAVVGGIGYLIWAFNDVAQVVALVLFVILVLSLFENRGGCENK